MSTASTITDLHDKRVLVMGVGRFGGGVGVTTWLVEQGARVTVTDLDPGAAEHPAIKPLLDAGTISATLGSHDAEDFRQADIIVANPAVPKPWNNPFIQTARDHVAAITTEIALACERLPSRTRIVGVTGSAGKSTTSAMIAHMLERSGTPAVLGGNIGGSLLGRLDKIDETTWVVLELSSAMLYWLRECLPAWSPAIACVTNFAPNHLDWHGSLEHYLASKQHILTCQRPGDMAVLGEDVAHWPIAPGVTVVPPASVDPAEAVLPGAHNQTNASLAAAVGRAIGIEDAASLAGSFEGLPHRLRTVLTARGVRFIDDSKSTTPDATVRAIEAVNDPSKVWLIAGGHDKAIDPTPMVDRFGELAGVMLIGATAGELAQRYGSNVHARQCGTLDSAMQELTRVVSEGDTVLLSPGHASWDQFANYESRGLAFSRLAQELFGSA